MTDRKSSDVEVKTILKLFYWRSFERDHDFFMRKLAPKRFCEFFSFPTVLFSSNSILKSVERSRQLAKHAKFRKSKIPWVILNMIEDGLEMQF